MRSAEWHFTVGTSSVLVLGPNPKRRTLSFSADGVNMLTLSTQFSPVSGQGLVLTTNEPTLTVDYEDIGSRITQPWYAIANNANSALTIIEGFD